MLWILWPMAVFGCVSSAKSAVERYTMRRIDRRKRKALAAQEQEMRNNRLAAVAFGQTGHA